MPAAASCNRASVWACWPRSRNSAAFRAWRISSPRPPLGTKGIGASGRRPPRPPQPRRIARSRRAFGRREPARGLGPGAGRRARSAAARRADQPSRPRASTGSRSCCSSRARSLFITHDRALPPRALSHAHRLARPRPAAPSSTPASTAPPAPGGPPRSRGARGNAWRRRLAHRAYWYLAGRHRPALRAEGRAGDSWHMRRRTRRAADPIGPAGSSSLRGRARRRHSSSRSRPSIFANAGGRVLLKDFKTTIMRGDKHRPHRPEWRRQDPPSLKLLLGQIKPDHRHFHATAPIWIPADSRPEGPVGRRRQDRRGAHWPRPATASCDPSAARATSLGGFARFPVRARPGARCRSPASPAANAPASCSPQPLCRARQSSWSWTSRPTTSIPRPSTCWRISLVDYEGTRPPGEPRPRFPRPPGDLGHRHGRRRQRGRACRAAIRYLPQPADPAKSGAGRSAPTNPGAERRPRAAPTPRSYKEQRELDGLPRETRPVCMPELATTWRRRWPFPALMAATGPAMRSRRPVSPPRSRRSRAAAEERWLELEHKREELARGFPGPRDGGRDHSPICTPATTWGCWW